VKTVYECLPVSNVKELTDDSYHPNCSTALYDAMGSSITTLSNKIKEGDKVLVTVVTDGQENASVEYSGAAVKALVDNFKSKGWVFAYIGANHDVKKVGADLSISNIMSFEASSAGTKTMSKKLNASRENLYCSIANDDFCAEIANEKFF
jgi:primase-polymerase (primpol)-like protein